MSQSYFLNFRGIQLEKYVFFLDHFDYFFYTSYFTYTYIDKKVILGMLFICYVIIYSFIARCVFFKISGFSLNVSDNAVSKTSKKNDFFVSVNKFD